VTGSLIALDTNCAIAVLAGTGAAITTIGSFGEPCLPVPVLGELRYGALNSERSATNLAAVEAMAGRCRILTADRRTAEIYAEVRLALKQRGRPIPENDVWIAALCVQHDATLATADAHFASVPGLRVIKWS